MGSHVEIVRGLYDSFAAGYVPAVLGAMDPNLEWNEAESFYLADRDRLWSRASFLGFAAAGGRTRRRLTCVT